jgi:hypothetical protein
MSQQCIGEQDCGVYVTPAAFGVPTYPQNYAAGKCIYSASQYLYFAWTCGAGTAPLLAVAPTPTAAPSPAVTCGTQEPGLIQMSCGGFTITNVTFFDFGGPYVGGHNYGFNTGMACASGDSINPYSTTPGLRQVVASLCIGLTYCVVNVTTATYTPLNTVNSGAGIAPLFVAWSLQCGTLPSAAPSGYTGMSTASALVPAGEDAPIVCAHAAIITNITFAR